MLDPFSCEIVRLYLFLTDSRSPASFTILKNFPFSRERRFFGESNSEIFPSSKTNILKEKRSWVAIHIFLFFRTTKLSGVKGSTEFSRDTQSLELISEVTKRSSKFIHVVVLALISNFRLKCKKSDEISVGRKNHFPRYMPG